MQVAINIVAHSPLDRVVSTLPISGSIAALARWNMSTQPPRMNSGALCRMVLIGAGVCSGVSGTRPPWASSGSTSRGRMRPSASSAGISSAAVTKNTQRGESRYPTAPIPAAATPLPIEAKRALRPSRSPIAAWPTSPRLIATTQGPSTQLAAA